MFQNICIIYKNTSICSNLKENILKDIMVLQVIWRKKLNCYPTIITIKNCHLSPDKGQDHEFYTYKGNSNSHLPSPKINKRSNNKTLVYKGKLMEIPKYDRNLCANSGTPKC